MHLSYAPPTPSPGEVTSPSPTVTTTQVSTTAPDQLPVTGPGGDVWGVLASGLVLVLVGLVVLAAVTRFRRKREA